MYPAVWTVYIYRRAPGKAEERGQVYGISGEEHMVGSYRYWTILESTPG